MVSTRRKDEAYALALCDEVIGSPSIREARFGWLQGDVSPRTGRSMPLPVDAYWPDLSLVVEFWELQHDNPSAFFDRRTETVSGVPRREQRRLYDERRADLVPQHGLTLVILRKAELSSTPRGSLRYEREHDIGVIRERLAAFASPAVLGSPIPDPRALP